MQKNLEGEMRMIRNTAIYIDGKKYTIDDVKSLIQENKNLHQELQNTIHDLNLLLVGSL